MTAAVLIALACAAAAFVLGPLVRPEAASQWETERDRLVHARETAYRALRDLEMDRDTGKIGELLEAERELARVTTELEQLKGAVTLWDNQVALATVEVTMSERQLNMNRAAIAPA